MISLSDIYQIRSQLEDGPQPGVIPGGIAGALVAQNFSVITRSNAPAKYQQARPRLEVVAQVGAATGKKDFRQADQQMAFSAWKFRLSVQCLTVAASDGQNVQHEQFLGQVRTVLSTLAQSSWNDLLNFPNMLIAEPLRDSGSQSHAIKDGVEYSVLNYDAIVMVRPGVW